MVYLPRPEDIFLNDDGSVNTRSIIALRDVVDLAIANLNSGISLGTASVDNLKAGLLDAVYAHATTPATPNTEFTVKHTLGRVPIGFDTVSIDKAGILYVSRQGSWLETSIFLKCSVATATITIRVY